MWMLELVGATVAVGTVVGLVWRVTEDWWEKRQSRKALEVELTQTEDETPAPVRAPVNPNAN